MRARSRAEFLWSWPWSGKLTVAAFIAQSMRLWMRERIDWRNTSRALCILRLQYVRALGLSAKSIRSCLSGLANLHAPWADNDPETRDCNSPRPLGPPQRTTVRCERFSANDIATPTSLGNQKDTRNGCACGGRQPLGATLDQKANRQSLNKRPRPKRHSGWLALQILSVIRSISTQKDTLSLAEPSK